MNFIYLFIVSFPLFFLLHPVLHSQVKPRTVVPSREFNLDASQEMQLASAMCVICRSYHHFKVNPWKECRVFEKPMYTRCLMANVSLDCHLY